MKKILSMGVVALFFGFFISSGAFAEKEPAVEINSISHIKTSNISTEKEREMKKGLTRVGLPFIENRGQADEKVVFYAKTLGGTLFVTKKGELVYFLPRYEDKAEGNGLETKAKVKSPKVTGGVVLKERLIDAEIKGIKGEDPSETKVGYFKGKDEAQWRSHIPAYSLVSLGEVYEGIELSLKAYGKNVEKLFYVRPPSEPERITLSVEGADEIRVDEKTGELVVKTGLGDVRFTKPVAYYLDEPEKKVGVSYRVKGNTYTFALNDYDSRIRGRP